MDTCRLWNLLPGGMRVKMDCKGWWGSWVMLMPLWVHHAHHAEMMHPWCILLYWNSPSKHWRPPLGTQVPIFMSNSGLSFWVCMQVSKFGMRNSNGVGRRSCMLICRLWWWSSVLLGRPHASIVWAVEPSDLCGWNNHVFCTNIALGITY